MPDEVTSISAVTSTSDGSVKISVEKYNELLEKIANQKGSISKLEERLNKALREPPVVNRTTVIKTPEIAARELRVWGGGLMGVGASLFVIGIFVFRSGLK